MGYLYILLAYACLITMYVGYAIHDHITFANGIIPLGLLHELSPMLLLTTILLIPSLVLH